jgi:H+/Cl- antiporter ClcA
VEPLVLIASLAKWLVLSALTGGVAGLAVVGFLHVLGAGIEFASKISYWWIALPVGGFVSAAIIHYISPEAYGHGTEAVIRAVNKGQGEIPVIVAPVKALATVISLSVGASAGKEGPSAQIGGALASGISDLLRLDAEDHRKLTMCGLAAGFGIVTGAPVSGAIFAVEALVMGSTASSALLPAVIASTSSVFTARALGWWHPLQAHVHVEAMDPALLARVVLCALLLGLVAYIFIEAVETSERLFHRMRVFQPARTFIGGVLLVALAVAFSRQYLGLGTEIYEAALEGHSVPTWAFALKILFVAVTLGAGFSGGAMTPVFVIGAAAGSTLGRLLGFDPVFAAAVGIVGLLAGAANTPIAALVLGLERFGPGFGIYGVVASVVSFVVVGHRSINATQLLGSPKTHSLVVDMGHTCEEAESVRLREDAQHRLDAVFGAHVEVAPMRSPHRTPPHR